MTRNDFCGARIFHKGRQITNPRLKPGYAEREFFHKQRPQADPFRMFLFFILHIWAPDMRRWLLSIPCLWNFRILLVVICFLCLCGVTITNYKNSLFMSIKDIMDLSHVLCCYYDLYRKYPRYTQLSPPHGPHSGRFLLYCIYQYKQRIERSCVQQKLDIINNIQIFCMIEQNKIFSVKSWNIK